MRERGCGHAGPSHLTGVSLASWFPPGHALLLSGQGRDPPLASFGLQVGPSPSYARPIVQDLEVMVTEEGAGNIVHLADVLELGRRR